MDSEYVRILGPSISSVSPGKAICYSDTVHLYASGGIKYSWTPAEGLTNPAISNPIASPVKTTKYEVMVTDNNGCNAYGNVTVTLRDSVLKAVIDGPSLACPGDMILFRDTSIGQITSWHWDFGNGNTSDQQNNPVFSVILLPMVFYFLLPLPLQIQQDVCKQERRSLNQWIIVLLLCLLHLHPNNDGLNDFLFPAQCHTKRPILHLKFSTAGVS